MMCEQARLCSPVQRILVEQEDEASDRRVKISVESYDEGLGWYTSGSLSLPLNQLPLLEQAIAGMRTDCSQECLGGGNIIPFCSLLPQPAVTTSA
jgi:hypothetical protein